MNRSFSVRNLSLLFSTLIFSATSFVQAETIEFAEEELAKESVLPVFSKQVVVRERAVTTAKRFEIGGGVGLNLIEPLYEQLLFNITGAYHLNEVSGINLSAYFLGTGLSSAGEDLKNGKGINVIFDASLAPQVENMLFANYQFTAYYGKISVTKQSVMNLSLYGLAGVGVVNWSDQTEIGLDFGIGQKLYFTPNFGFRADLTMAIYQGPDVTNPGGDGSLAGTARDSGDFDSTLYIRPFLTASLIYLF